MKLIDIEPALYDLQAIADLLPLEKKEVMEQAIRIVQNQPEIPVERIRKMITEKQEDKRMRKFINPDIVSIDNYTEDDIWTAEEIETTYRSEPDLYEKYPTLDEYIDHLIETGGIIEIK